ncbi:hypothetical protein [Burkholderia arboris]|uniref:hypothetical protein n=1 Tax=Burkholderia arboris TaxID=488730 RepID=UPI001CF2D5C5|nr:hypothetical protein [Burkholderia arboris]MCA8494014.1 hypothetical protein [Burkholderia arboris]
MEFKSLNVGDVDPELNKIVTKPIIQSDDFMVYLDENYDIQWHVSEVDGPVKFGSVLNAVAAIELRSEFLRSEEQLFLRIRSLAGEAVARAIDDKDEKSAMAALQMAEGILAKRNAELSRRWYYFAAQNLVLGLFAIAVFFWLTRSWLPWDMLIGRTAFNFIFCAVAGAVGALISIILRSHSIELDAMSGQLAHEMESRARILTGMVAAVAFGFATKLGWLSIFHGDANSITFLSVLGLVSGASERAVPNFLSRFDPAGTLHDDRAKGGRGAKQRHEASDEAPE